jgi:hypothetical protein
MVSPVAEGQFLQSLEAAFQESNTDFARAYYLFATARLVPTYNSQEIYAKYPILSDKSTFERLKADYDANPKDETLKRLFVAVLDTYVGNQLAAQSDEFQNLKNTLTIDVSGLELKKADGSELTELLYEDVYEWLKKLPEKARRQELYQRMSAAWSEHLAPRFLALMHAEQALYESLGYGDRVKFTSQTTGHELEKLGEKAGVLLSATEIQYLDLVAPFYEKRTGQLFDRDATRADIAYVFHGPSDEMAEINAKFPEAKLLGLARETFDGLGLDYGTIARTVDFPNLEDYDREVRDYAGEERRILLDVAKREGKRSRAYVYPSKTPTEIYLSVKPEGGLDDYSAFFHESGHALHFAYESPRLGFAMAQMGNNTTTESYAYLFQNLFLNRHWLQNQAGLKAEDARKVVRHIALNDLYMLRRYASKLKFELVLFDGRGFEKKGPVYAELLTNGTGFQYDAEGWTRDVDAGFYVADYFTAWALEAQLREYLCRNYGSSDDARNEDWYLNPQAGEFLKTLWERGNISQHALSTALGYNDPTDVGPLLRLMRQNLCA